MDYVDGALTIVAAAQSIDFAPLADQTIGTPPIVLHATATSGLVVVHLEHPDGLHDRWQERSTG